MKNVKLLMYSVHLILILVSGGAFSTSTITGVSETTSNLLTTSAGETTIPYDPTVTVFNITNQSTANSTPEVPTTFTTPTTTNGTTVTTLSPTTSSSATGAVTTSPSNTTTTASTTTTTKTTTTTTTSTTQPTTTTTQPTITTQPTTTTPPTTTTTTTTTTNPDPGPVSNTTNILIGCLVFLAVAIILFAVVLYYYCNNKQFPWCAKYRTADSESIPLEVTSNTRLTNRRSLYGKHKYVVGQMAINAADFEADYMKKSADDNRHFRMEFMSIDPGTSEKSAAVISENKIKNRYDNVLPYDLTRVKLSETPNDPYSDYINANFISGYMKDKQWIACQGPKEETFNDFWKMVWEQNSHVIIMVTRLVEQQNKVKCHQYWPENSDSQQGDFGTQTYGNYTVQMVDMQERGFYVIRTFQLTYLQEAVRTVYQYHYVAWPDFGVPGNASHLLQFRRRIVAQTPEDAGPTVIHCSAGVGRTGTYILIDATIEQLKVEGKTDLYSFLTHMRTQRMMLVQTDAQYAFAHKAVLEYIKYECSEVPTSRFKKQVQDLRERKNVSEETELEIEFQKLLKMPLAKDHLKHGRKSLKKNRVLQIMPYDFNRVLLPRKPGNDRSDYINASYIDGFRGKKTFIATQGPLPDTVHDFWTMVWQNHVTNLVMLTRLEEKGHSTCYCYWPNKENNLTVDNFKVSLASQDDDDIVDYVVRELIVTNNQQMGEERKVRQFHYKGWPDVGGGSPKDAQGLIEIINRLNIKSVVTEPILVHCSSGGGRTGVFCALAVLIDQADCEGLVDVFQTVRYLREQRPHMIQTQEQYYFCYISLLQYLESNQVEDSDTMVSSLPPLTNEQNATALQTTAVTHSALSNVIGGKDNLGSMNNTLMVGSTSSNAPSEVEIESSHKNESYDSDVPLVDPTLLADAIATPEVQDSAASSNSSSDFEIVNENKQNI